MSRFFLYCCVGMINTCIGFGAIFLLVFAGVVPELANFLGYCLGIVCSFFLNNALTFSQTQISKLKGLSKFILSMGIAYLINLGVLFVGYRILGINVYIAQIIAGVSYTLCGFILSKWFVWREERSLQE
ncbi:GtrA family protein [Helicobacter cholecystus]|uniref:GtrA family protein n=1 Tax=Helicobacter cholecystus TaxID=45498 RepID=UPI002738D4D9|nr:GtrA family protein [Helicobacter cholecystus]